MSQVHSVDASEGLVVRERVGVFVVIKGERVLLRLFKKTGTVFLVTGEGWSLSTLGVEDVRIVSPSNFKLNSGILVVLKLETFRINVVWDG